jgi:hypothetical protein
MVRRNWPYRGADLRMRRARSALLLFASVTAVVLGLVPAPALAATINVACGDVPGLVAAITGAAPGDTISLAAGCTYTLTAADNPGLGSGSNGLPVITKTLTIEGNNATITRSGATQFRFFEVFPTGNLTLDRLTLSNGSLNGAPGVTIGGAIFVRQGTLTLKNSSLAGNQAPLAGAIINYGTSTITGSTLVGNNSGAEVGGALSISRTASWRATREGTAPRHPSGADR